MCGGGAAGGKTTVEERRPAQKHNYPSPVFFISGPRFLFLVFSFECEQESIEVKNMGIEFLGEVLAYLLNPAV